MQFSRIPGHETLISQFKAMVNRGKTPHAILLLGPKGTAKLPLSIAFANYIQCLNKADDVCGSCSACLKSQKFIHPDIHFSYPVVKKEKLKREDTTSKDFLIPFRTFCQDQTFAEIDSWISTIANTTSIANINTKECNEIIGKLSLQSFEGSHKVLVIWMAEYLAKDSNRLLKLIEEPTDDTIIILIAENQDKILPTILSRCQIFNVPRFSDQEILNFIDQQDVSPSLNKQEVAQLANGDLDKAIKLSQNMSQDQSAFLLQWMRVSWKSHPDGIFQLVSDFVKRSKDEQKMFYEYGIHFFREYLIYLYTSNVQKMKLSDKEKNTALQMTKTIDEYKAQQLTQMFTESIHLINRNINGKILFSANSFQLGNIMKGVA